MLFGSSSVALLAVHRPMRAEPFSEVERAGLALLLPHVGRAIQIAGLMGGLQANKQAQTRAFDRLRIAAVVVSPNGAIRWANVAAERLFRDGDALLSVSGMLRARRSHDALQRMIHDCANRSDLAIAPGGLLALPRPGRASLSILIGPLENETPGIGTTSRGAVVFIHDPERLGQPDEPALMQLYGLTAAEARLASALIGGTRLDDYANQRPITLATAKTQMRHLFAKTATNRQAELVAKLSRDSILRMASPLLRVRPAQCAKVGIYHPFG